MSLNTVNSGKVKNGLVIDKTNQNILSSNQAIGRVDFECNYVEGKGCHLSFNDTNYSSRNVAKLISTEEANKLYSGLTDLIKKLEIILKLLANNKITTEKANKRIQNFLAEFARFSPEGFEEVIKNLNAGLNSLNNIDASEFKDVVSDSCKDLTEIKQKLEKSKCSLSVINKVKNFFKFPILKIFYLLESFFTKLFSFSTKTKQVAADEKNNLSNNDTTKSSLLEEKIDVKEPKDTKHYDEKTNVVKGESDIPAVTKPSSAKEDQMLNAIPEAKNNETTEKTQSTQKHSDASVKSGASAASSGISATFETGQVDGETIDASLVLTEELRVTEENEEGDEPRVPESVSSVQGQPDGTSVESDTPSKEKTESEASNAAAVKIPVAGSSQVSQPTDDTKIEIEYSTVAEEIKTSVSLQDYSDLTITQKKALISTVIKGNDINQIRKLINILKAFIDNDKDLIYQALVKCENIEIFKEFFGADIRFAKLQDSKSCMTLVMHSIKKNNQALFLLLISNLSKEDLDVTNYNNQTALMLAVKNRLYYYVNILIQKGSDLYTKDKNDKTALDYSYQNAQNYGTDQVISIKNFLEMEYRKREIDNAIEKGDFDYIKSNFDKLKVQDYKSKAGDNIISQCVLKTPVDKRDNLSDIVVFLNSKGVSVEHKNNQGYTPLQFIVCMESKDVIKALHDHPDCHIDLTARGNSNSILMHAILSSANNREVIEYLLQFFDINDNDNEKQNTLMLSLRAEKQYLVEKILTEYSADLNLNHKDDRGYTALRYAILAGNIYAVKSLLELNANVEELDIKLAKQNAQKPNGKYIIELLER